MKLINLQLIIFVILLLSANRIIAQCTPAAPAVAACSGGNGAGSNGVNVNGGQTYWFTGGPTTWASGINLNGGTFRVCGNLTFNSISFNSGTLIIESGGSLTLNLGGDLALNGGSSICNRGTFNLNTNLRMQNANNTIWVSGSSASFSVTGQLEINSATSKVINVGGSMTLGSIYVQGSASAGAVCMQVGSCFTCNGGANSITNNFTNAFSFSGTGNAAVTFNGNAVLNNAFACCSNVIVCRNSGATTSGSGGWGSATVINPCPNCSSALPVELLYFTAESCNNSVCLNWSTASETNNDFFTVEKSNNAISFTSIQNINSLAAGGNSSTALKYGTYDILPNLGTNYYRLKQTDYDGKYTYSNIVAIDYDNNNNQVSIFPNPFSTKIIVTSNNTDLIIDILNSSGKKISSSNIQSNTTSTIDTDHLSCGIYLIIARDNNGSILLKEKLIKK